MSPTIDIVPDLNRVVTEFERAWQEDGRADLTSYLPRRDHPHFHRIASELVCIDLEMRWTRGEPKRLADYRSEVPQLFHDPAAVRELAFEEYRQRVQAGEPVEPVEYQKQYGVSVVSWPRPGPQAVDSQVRTRVLDLRPTEDRLLKTADVQAAIVAALRQSSPDEADQLDDALRHLPSSGDRVFGFELVELLGEGAFARVFRARQTELADRPVALKLAVSLNDEPRKLARLQHTNIVPIYSTHNNGTLHGVCMPYLGSLALDHLLKSMSASPGSLPRSGRDLLSTLFEKQSATQEQPSRPTGNPTTIPEPKPGVVATPVLDLMARYSHIEAVLWMGAKLADGLAHAHERGILHLDLKPANILLTDDGQPMLLDFNLSIDLTAGTPLDRVRLGGTLPYMSPEQLDAFAGGIRDLDARSDLFSIGLILYELLTGLPAYPKRFGEMRDLIAAMRVDRRRPPRSPRELNPAITPAVESIILKLLDPDRSQRYQAAAHVREDLERQLADLPLRHAPDRSVRELAGKWCRRHPRLAVGGLVGAVAGSLLLGSLIALGIAQTRAAARQVEIETAAARELWSQEMKEAQSVQVMLSTSRSEILKARLEKGIDCGKEVLQRYGIGEDPRWLEKPELARLLGDEREALRLECGEMLLLMAAAEQTLADLARNTDPVARAAGLRSALHWNELAEVCYLPGQIPQRLAEQRAEMQKELPDRPIRPLPPPGELAANLDAYHQGAKQVLEGNYQEALKYLVPFTEDHPRHFQSWFFRGICHDNLAQFVDAAECFTACLALGHDQAIVLFNRGLVRLRQREFSRAEADFNRVLLLQPKWADAQMERAITRKSQGRYAEAIDDLTSAVADPGASLRARFLLWEVRQLAGQQDEAKREFAAAMKIEPKEELDWSTRGFARMTTEPAEALKDLDQALAINPRSREALVNKSLILSDHLDRPREAIAVLDRFLEFYPANIDWRLNRAVVLARVGECGKARADAEHCLAHDRTTFLIYQAVGVYAQISRHEPKSNARQEALALLAMALQKGFNDFEMIRTDTDIDPIRGEPEFKRLVEAAQALSKKG